jgi:hypothetical protein
MPEIWIAGSLSRLSLDQMHREMGFLGDAARGFPTGNCVETRKAEITESEASNLKSGRGSGSGFVLAPTPRLISHL